MLMTTSSSIFNNIEVVYISSGWVKIRLLTKIQLKSALKVKLGGGMVVQLNYLVYPSG